jgi:small subunit ribosomal protein S8
MVGKNEVRLPSSKVKITVAKELARAGYLTDVKVEKASPRDIMIVTIARDGENANITEIARVSKPGRRVYARADEIPRVKSGRGVMIVSTSKGIMTGAEAIKNRLGGELICKVY